MWEREGEMEEDSDKVGRRVCKREREREGIGTESDGRKRERGRRDEE